MHYGLTTYLLETLSVHRQVLGLRIEILSRAKYFRKKFEVGALPIEQRPLFEEMEVNRAAVHI